MVFSSTLWKIIFTLVATDAHKFVRFKTSYTWFLFQEEEEKSFHPSQRNRHYALKNILPKESGDVDIKLTSKNAYFKTVGLHNDGRRWKEGTLNYNGVIPKTNAYKIIDRVSFNALKRVSVFLESGKQSCEAWFQRYIWYIFRHRTSIFRFQPKKRSNVSSKEQPIKIGFKSAFSHRNSQQYKMFPDVILNSLILPAPD